VAHADAVEVENRDGLVHAVTRLGVGLALHLADVLLVLCVVELQLLDGELVEQIARLDGAEAVDGDEPALGVLAGDHRHPSFLELCALFERTVANCVDAVLLAPLERFANHFVCARNPVLFLVSVATNELNQHQFVNMFVAKKFLDLCVERK
jgi:hypothetical protein